MAIGSQVRFGPSLTPMVRILIVSNAVIFLLQILFRNLIGVGVLETYFSLQPDQVSRLWIWQLITYSFLHADFFHLLFNMLALWMFGSELENHWNSEIFLKLYLFSCFLGGLLTYIVNFWWSQGVVVGASGGVYGLLLAYAMIWPNREILFMMIFPLKAKYFVFILMLMIAFAQGGRVAHMAHAGGFLGGFLFVRYFDLFRNLLNWNFSFSRYMQKRKFKKYQEEMDMRVNSKQKVDELLEKISKYGMKSLTKKERTFLNEASKDYYTEE
ncbi:MAG: rhomboid family intramembrane serine protease [Leptospira sp.]|nr:rhomboid family intramembrane serine protease [Leptospira sp.]